MARELLEINLEKNSISSFLLTWILSSLNVVSLIIALSTIYTLHNDFRRFGLNKVMDTSRRRIRMFFYLMAIVPFFLSVVGHLGAQYPGASRWIFPSSNLVLAFLFLFYLRMTFVSAGTYDSIRHHLEQTKDKCGFPRMENRLLCRCFLAPNAWKGMRRRLFWCLLVFVKPFVSYIRSALIEFRGDNFDKRWKKSSMTLIILILTFGPVQGLRCFEAVLGPLSRIDRMKQKTILTQFLVPLLQIQMSLIDYLVSNKYIDDLNDEKAENRGAKIVGFLFCIEMVFIGVATSYIYHATDLLRWQELEKGWASTKDLFSKKRSNQYAIKNNYVPESSYSRNGSQQESLKPAYKKVLGNEDDRDQTMTEEGLPNGGNTYQTFRDSVSNKNKNRRKLSDETSSTVLLTEYNKENSKN